MIIKKDVDDIEIINDVIIINDKSDLYLYSCEEIPPNLQFIGNIILKSK
jgi:hypothetical protein